MAAPVSGSRSDYPPPRQSITDIEDLYKLAGITIPGRILDPEPKKEPLPVAKVHNRAGLFKRLLNRVRNL